MRKRRKFLIFVTVLIAVGWAGWHLLPTSHKARVIRFVPVGGPYQTFNRLAEMLQIGMTPEEVRAILGVPGRVVELSSGHRWIYDEVEATTGWLCILDFVHSEGVYRLQYFRNVEHVVFPTSRRREFGSPIDDDYPLKTLKPDKIGTNNRARY